MDNAGAVTAKLNGVILRKAEIEADFERVYLKVFERIALMEHFEGNDMLEIFGDLGG